jgi:hypothetical protein
MRFSILFGLILVVLISVNGRVPPAFSKSVGRPGPQAVVYKTKADYSQYVTVMLSDDKSKIVSYPAPQDVFTSGKLAIPTELPHGFWLDNRGIGPNSCFVKITYEEYSKMSQAPSTDELYNLIIDKNPFTEMYDLGARNKFSDDQIRMIVKKHKLKDYKKLL